MTEIVLDIRTLLFTDPFSSCLWNLDEPISRLDVETALCELQVTKPVDEPKTRQEHINKIAWLYIYGTNEDIVVSSLEPLKVVSGYHRFCAAILRGDTFIKVKTQT